MSELIPFEFDNRQVRILQDGNGEPLFVAKDVAEALGYVWYGASGTMPHVPGEWKETRLVQTTSGMQEMSVLTEQGFYFFLGRSGKPGALPLQKLVAGEILPSIRKTGSYSVVPPASPLPYPLDFDLQFAETTARMLRMSDTSKLRMMSDMYKARGGAPTFLPAYVNEGLTRAITDLLKEHGSSLSAVAANRILIEMGHLKEEERPSSKGSTKRFKSITDLGLQYGRNETSPENPRETQPRYYVAKFPELLDLINTHRSKNKNA